MARRATVRVSELKKGGVRGFSPSSPTARTNLYGVLDNYRTIIEDYLKVVSVLEYVL